MLTWCYNNNNSVLFFHVLFLHIGAHKPIKKQRIKTLRIFIEFLNWVLLAMDEWVGCTQQWQVSEFACVAHIAL